MGKNSISTLPVAETVLLANRIVAACGPGPTNTYGIAQSDVTQLGTNAAALTTAGSAVEDALATYHAAVAARNTKLKTIRYILSSVSRQAYANPVVNREKIVALGLSPRSKNRAKAVPQTPYGLAAEPDANGAMKLSWNRAGNPAGVMFVVEARVANGTWTPVANTSATRTTLNDLLPGGPIEFRVMALKNDAASLPSPLLTLFPSASVPPLRVAA